MTDRTRVNPVLIGRESLPKHAKTNRTSEREKQRDLQKEGKEDRTSERSS